MLVEYRWGRFQPFFLIFGQSANPRTRKRIDELGIDFDDRISLSKPLRGRAQLRLFPPLSAEGRSTAEILQALTEILDPKVLPESGRY